MNGKNKINIITLGCSKNLVDSEVLKAQIESSGIEVVHNSESTDAKTVIINTCGFVNDAKEEAINTILDAIEAKRSGHINKLFVMGCLSERFKNDLKKEMPEVDEYFGVNNLEDILNALKLELNSEKKGARSILTPKHFAYLKISEGCSRNCSFCAIPLIRGKHISKSLEDILIEANSLVNQGVKEIILIAQDLTFYGYDLYQKSMIVELIKNLIKIEKLKWLRLHYLYPANFPEEIIDLMKTSEKICKYVDIPVQHISDKMLGVMKRGHKKQETIELIKKFRSQIPEVAIRTTILVGHPNETEEDFNELVDFVKDIKFERLGVFEYSEEEGTYSAENYKELIPYKIKKRRAEKLMSVQNKIALENNEKFYGKVVEVLIDDKQGDFYIGRTEYDSPEVDNEVLVEASKTKLEIGNFYKVKINKISDYDIYGEIV